MLYESDKWADSTISDVFKVFLEHIVQTARDAPLTLARSSLVKDAGPRYTRESFSLDFWDFLTENQRIDSNRVPRQVDIHL